MNNFDKCEKEHLTKGEGDWVGEYDNECLECGNPCENDLCSKECYLIGKAEHALSQHDKG